MDFQRSGRNQPGTLIAARYRVGALLGEGSMGAVYAGVDERLGRPVALKFLRQNEQEAPHAVERFEREARSAAQLHHPNIVSISDFLKNEGRPFLVMERLEGQTLQHTLLERTLGRGEAIEIQLQVLSALGAAHEAGVLHRDIKPANIFLIPLETGGTLVKLLDFGLARLLEEKKGKRLTATGITLGTPAYMAPERLMGAGIDPRSDLYSVGVCLYESVRGELPGAGSNDEKPHAEGGPTSDPSLDLVIRQACAHQPGLRFASAAEMAAALRHVSAGATELGQKKADLSSVKHGAWRSPAALRAGAAAAALVVQVTASVIWLGSGPPQQPVGAPWQSTRSEAPVDNHHDRPSANGADQPEEITAEVSADVLPSDIVETEQVEAERVETEQVAPTAPTALEVSAPGPMRSAPARTHTRRTPNEPTIRERTQPAPNVSMTALAERPIVPDWGQLERDRDAEQLE